MINGAIGDLARSNVLRSQSSEMQAEMSRLVTELGSGLVLDKTERLNADFSHLAYVERNLQLSQSYRTSAQEAASFMQAAQFSLDRVSSELNHVTQTMLTVVTSSSDGGVIEVSSEAKASFSNVISALNTKVAGRAIFSGEASDRPPLASAETLFADLTAEVDGLTTFAQVEAAIDTWFSDPAGGFATLAYQGGQESLGMFELGPDQKVEFDTKANDPSVIETLKALAFAALSGADGLAGDMTMRKEMISHATDLGLAAGQRLTQTQAHIGVKESVVERQSVRLQAQNASLRIAQSDLLKADPYETAVRLEETQVRLESLYAATSRLSQLSLVRFLS